MRIADLEGPKATVRLYSDQRTHSNRAKTRSVQALKGRWLDWPNSYFLTPLIGSNAQSPIDWNSMINSALESKFNVYHFSRVQAPFISVISC